MWKTYTPANSGLDEAAKTFTAKVVEIINGDGLTVKLQIEDIFIKYQTTKVNFTPFLSVILPSCSNFLILLELLILLRMAHQHQYVLIKKNVPLYDIPYFFEAREFLRKKLIGKKINGYIDYIQPKSDDYVEKVCCTVMLNKAWMLCYILHYKLWQQIYYSFYLQQ